jgi:hypothetical protein
MTGYDDAGYPGTIMVNSLLCMGYKLEYGVGYIGQNTAGMLNFRSFPSPLTVPAIYSTTAIRQETE